MLTIRDLHVNVGETQILKGLDLEVGAGQVHAIMGPNGSGKSTLSYTLSGKDGYEVTGGDILFKGESILEKSADERARDGIFLAFQYPVEIPGVRSKQFLRSCINAVRKHRGQEEMAPVEFLKTLRQRMKLVKMDEALVNRDLMSGFSGGEKKRFEILQMAMLEPSFCILDETDSGLDIDALKAVSEGVNALRAADRSMLIITHYQRLLDYIKPDVVHVLKNGRIVKSGGPELALELEAEGYDSVEQSEASL